MPPGDPPEDPITVEYDLIDITPKQLSPFLRKELERFEQYLREVARLPSRDQVQAQIKLFKWEKDPATKGLEGIVRLVSGWIRYKVQVANGEDYSFRLEIF